MYKIIIKGKFQKWIKIDPIEHKDECEVELSPEELGIQLRDQGYENDIGLELLHPESKPELKGSKPLPCEHLYFKIENSKLTELYIDNEQWIRKPELASEELKNILSQSWYNCYYDEVGEKQQKKMSEFLEDNNDFIVALSKGECKERGQAIVLYALLVIKFTKFIQAFNSRRIKELKAKLIDIIDEIL